MPNHETKIAAPGAAATPAAGALSAADKHRRYLFPCATTYYATPLTLVRGEGMHLWDDAGRKYLDGFAGVMTVSVGHCNPEVTDAIVRQAQTLVHVSTLYATPTLSDLAEALAAALPGGLTRVFLTNSGSEADETAVLLARVNTGQQEIVALRYGYSGRTLMAMSASGQASWKLLPQPVPGFVHALAPYCYRCPLKLTYPSCEVACANDVKEVIETATSGRIAGFLAEVIIGSGGFIVPPKEYFQRTVEIVRKAGGLFIADEVQTGFGRTGTMFGIEHYGVVPDVMTFAKGMANGSPVGCTATTDALAGAIRPLSFSTFGGNPVTSAAALATLRVIQKQNLAANARARGERLRAGLDDLKRRHPKIVGDVRGMGLMQGMELVGDGKAPDAKAVNRVLEHTKKRGVLIGKGGLWGNVLRISPPLVATDSHIDEMLAALGAAFDETAREIGRA